MSLKIIELITEDGFELNGLMNTVDTNDKDIKDKDVIVTIHGICSGMLKKRYFDLIDEAEKRNVDVLIFNNRGAGMIDTTAKMKGEDKILGSTFEEIGDSIYDVDAVVNYLYDAGYRKIHIGGHSLGCLKAIMYLNYLKSREDKKHIYDAIKTMSLISLVDFRYFIDKCAGKEHDIEALKSDAKKMLEEGRNEVVIKYDFFKIPLSAKTFLNYFGDESKVDYANYRDSNFEFKEINQIDKRKLFVYGNKHELVTYELDDIKKIMEEKIKGNKRIEIVDDANHSYVGHERELALRVLDFIKED